jgi:hypothetical protein
MNSTVPPPIVPGDVALGPPGGKDADSRGCMKWGLIGCAVLSLVAIAGMVLFLRRAPQLMETLLGATEAQVVAAIAPEVTAGDREAFEKEYAAFVAAAKAGKAKPEGIHEIQKKIVEALKDNRVNAEELRAITDALRAMPKA